MKRRNKGLMLLVTLLLITLFSTTVFAADEAEYVPKLFGTFWALIPPLVAIVLALITKEVYSSLFIGIVIGGVLYAGGSFEKTLTHVLSDGIVGSLSDSYNVGILVFLVVLGTIVALMNKAGGSAAFGEWASKHIKTRVGAQLATIALGCLIFVDDYFNCLTVGSVMRPVTDRHNVSRAKLAYLIDATAAPVCIIAPISSWAAAVTGFVKGEDGFVVFIKSIPYNYYALLTIVMMITIVVMKVDFGSMAKHEANAAKGDLFTTGKKIYEEIDNEGKEKKGKVCDLVVPVITLIICCIIGMIYTGGFFSGTDFVTAFSNSDASVGLALGSIFALVITLVFYVVRRILPFNECMDCLPEGFKAMVPAILILTFAWTLKNMTSSLGAAEFVEVIMKNSAEGFAIFLPAVIFVVGCGLAFATGTSWGTFGILIPIVVQAFQKTDPAMMIIAISACMAGAVCGDHCSPISDTTIMSSAGAQCEHTNHVSTQIPYAVTVAVVSFITYIISGALQKAAGIGWAALPIGIILMIGTIVGIKVLGSGKEVVND
ncbi:MULTISPECIES: Na+/H+ antiporter NhaC family protein [Eubacterium]|uniref:Na+/H+ antiporter NhaC family protein n=1 Tax=Eubacterium album TaxID=2978477 RepID=A0ABT2LY16_9FIRM|nr:MULTISPECIES: Na+/H+ antiporter NhaC family protein [unclassified Eubacterium (in: firmicutes)]MCT7398181.1 Na+/H+ antiporter NhaC family protein [Eubacterium sp. LFL-14]CDA28347.1 na+/H+ antiporter family protein [Eubacterium sp. CAG:156]